MKRAASPSPTARAKRPRPARAAAPLWPPVPQGGNANALGMVTVSKEGGAGTKHFGAAQALVGTAGTACVRPKAPENSSNSNSNSSNNNNGGSTNTNKT